MAYTNKTKKSSKNPHKSKRPPLQPYNGKAAVAAAPAVKRSNRIAKLYVLLSDCSVYRVSFLVVIHSSKCRTLLSCRKVDNGPKRAPKQPPRQQEPVKKARHARGNGLPTRIAQPLIALASIDEIMENTTKILPSSKTKQSNTIGSFTELAARLMHAANHPGLSQRAAEDDPTSILGKVEEFAHWARSDPNLYNDAEVTKNINASTGVTKAYERDKAKSYARFFGFIAAHPNPKIRLLAAWVDDPEQINKEERRLILLVRGIKHPSKIELLNYACTIFAVNMYKICMEEVNFQEASAEEVADGKYAPSSLNTYYKHIFAQLKQHSVMYEKKEFKSYKGSFLAALKMDFEKTLKVRPGFGTRKVAPVDSLAAQKLRNSGLNPFLMSMLDDQQSGFRDCTWILAINIGIVYMPRGTKEVNVCSVVASFLFQCHLPPSFTSLLQLGTKVSRRVYNWVANLMVESSFN
jgi:hypothetical protein